MEGEMNSDPATTVSDEFTKTELFVICTVFSIVILLRSYYLPITKKHFSFALTFRKTILSLYPCFSPSVFFYLMHKSRAGTDTLSILGHQMRFCPNLSIKGKVAV
ncbi:hypothetical protein Barb4_01033 [Bacteroidales bacterium Barb4]|nr:hypothetical protein Barb4_01033 [Bacteroidales bacterium Barb4]